MESRRVGRVRVMESEVRSRGSYRTFVECFALTVSRMGRERYGELIEEVARELSARPQGVWCYKGDSSEVSSIESAFRSPRRRQQFVVRTRVGRTELYVQLREPEVRA